MESHRRRSALRRQESEGLRAASHLDESGVIDPQQLDAVVIPVRDLSQAAQSRAEVSFRRRKVGAPGGLSGVRWARSQDLELGRPLRQPPVDGGRLRDSAHFAHVPAVPLRDHPYCLRTLHPILPPSITDNEFFAAWDASVEPALIHHYEASNASLAESTGLFMRDSFVVPDDGWECPAIAERNPAINEPRRSVQRWLGKKTRKRALNTRRPTLFAMSRTEPIRCSRDQQQRDPENARSPPTPQRNTARRTACAVRPIVSIEMRCVVAREVRLPGDAFHRAPISIVDPGIWGVSEVETPELRSPRELDIVGLGVVHVEAAHGVVDVRPHGHVAGGRKWPGGSPSGRTRPGCERVPHDRRTAAALSRRSS